MDTFTIQILIGLLGVIAIGVYAIAAAVWLRGDPEKMPVSIVTNNSAAPAKVEVSLLDHLRELENRLSEELAALYDHVTNTAEEVKDAPVMLQMVNPATPPPMVFAPSYPNATALRTAIAGSVSVQSIDLDGEMIHPGFGPSVRYVTQEDGSVKLA